MHVETDDLAVLLQLQQIDMEALRARKKLDALPQRQAILDARTKKQAVEQKRAQIEDLHAQADRKLSSIGDEDASLSRKQTRIQQEIDAVQGDYRSVESRTKELGGIAKRRAALEADLAAVSEELEKIEAVRAQVERALAAVEKQEAEATASFVREGGALKNQVAQLEAKRAMTASELPADLLATYEKTAARTGGVAVARLQDGKCGACRMPVEQGRLADLKAQGNVSPCPHCHRLLILL